MPDIQTDAESGPDLPIPRRWEPWRIAVVAAHLAPAALVGGLLLGLVGGAIGVALGFVALLVAPGWLLWKILRGPISTEALAVPALWIAFSFAVMSPAVGPMVFFGGPALAVEWYGLSVLIVLGVAGSMVPHPRIEPLNKSGIAVAATTVIAMVYRSFTWHGGSDDLSFLGYLRATSLGSYPSVNPFMAGDLPVNLRWRFSGWTGISGVLSHLGDADPQMVLRRVLPVILLLFAVSALYLLARVLSGDRMLAVLAAFAVLVVPIITGTSGKTDFKFIYKDIGYDKYAALLIFAPVAAALLITFYRSRSRSTGILVSVVVWASLFTHAVIMIEGIAILLLFVVIDGIVTRPPQWRAAAGWVLVVLSPILVTAALASFSGERQGTVASDVAELSDIAEKSRQIGPIEIWVPLPSMTPAEVLAAQPEEAPIVFSRGYANTPAGRIVAFLPNGWPIAYPGALRNTRYLIVAFALLTIVVGRRRDGVALWIVAASAAALSVYVVPPAAALAARFLTPWQLYRFAWELPVPLMVAWLASTWLKNTKWTAHKGIALGVLLGLVFAWSSHSTLLRTGPSPSSQRLTTTLEQFEGYSGVMLAPSTIMNGAVSMWPDLLAVSHRGFSTMSNAFAVSRQDEALERYADARRFFRSIPTSERLATLDRYDVRYVVIHKDNTDQFDLGALGLNRIKAVGQGYVLYERQS